MDQNHDSSELCPAHATPDRGIPARDPAKPSIHNVEDQSEVLDFFGSLHRPGEHGRVKRIDTHGAAIFLVGEHAYKVKRAVRFPFMDFSTVDKRRSACEAEIILNKTDAPEIYIGTIPIVRRNKRLHLGGRGRIVEWAVHMHRFDEEQTLDRIADNGELTGLLVAETAKAIVASHARAPERRGSNFAAALRELIRENGTSLAEAPDIFPLVRIDALTARCQEMLTCVDDLLQQRAGDGFVRRCHGDLHLRNLVLIKGRPTLFDALEFDEALATTDVLYDLAFLVMDVAERGLRIEANLFMNRYLAEARDDRQLAGLAAFPLFLAVRAAIRAKVIAAGLEHLGPLKRREARTQATRYFQFAEAMLRSEEPCLVGIGGLSGTGKTTLATRLAPDIGRSPGAVHLRSDLERKRQLHASELERLPASVYSRARTNAVYASLRRQAAIALDAGYAVIVDAVHLTPAERRAIEDVAREAGVGFGGLWLEAPLSVLVDRVMSRQGDASDADAAVVATQQRRRAGVVEWASIPASGDAQAVLTRARRLLASNRLRQLVRNKPRHRVI